MISGSGEREPTIWEELLGVVAARRLRYAIAAAGSLALLAGCVVFVTTSQVIGGLMLAPGATILLMWLMFRPAGEDDLLARWRRRRPWFIAAGLVSIAAGWVVFFTVHGDMGLLLVVLGGICLAAVLIGIEEDHRTGPTDGPWFGETSA